MNKDEAAAHNEAVYERIREAGRKAADQAIIDPQRLAAQANELIATTIDQMEDQFEERG